MRAIVHGELSMHLPEGWVDTTIVTLLGPPAAPLGLRTAKPEATPQPSFMLRTVALREPGGLGLEDVARAQEAMLRELVADLEIIATGTRRLPNGVDTATRELTMTSEGGELVWQLHVYFQAERRFFVAVGTAPLGAPRELLRAQLYGIVDSLHFTARGETS